jgi:hypothetical protein
MTTLVVIGVASDEFPHVSSFEIGDFQGQQVSLPEGNHYYMINHDY